MAEKPAPKKAVKSKQVMDVARPGKSTPSSSSRPIIMGHGPIMKDPMMSDKSVAVSDDSDPDAGEPITVKRSAKTIAPAATADEKPAKAKKTAEATITPPTDTTPPDLEPSDASIPESPTEETQQPEPAADQPAEDTQPETSEETPAEASDEAAVGALADQVTDKQKESAEVLQKQQELEKLIEQKKFYVPIGQVTHRRHTLWAILCLLALLLAVSALVYAADAELFDPGFDLPFDLVKV